MLKTLDPSSKIAISSSYDDVVYRNKMNYKNFTFNVCNEVIQTIPTVFYLRKNSYLTEIFNEKIDNLKSAGLIEYFVKKYLDPKYLRVKRVEQGPRALNMRELLIAFRLFAYGIISALVVFLIEIAVKIKSKSKTQIFIYQP